ncbi:hypothetical protein H1C71_004832 [Ictidomys tridecemlineatus]|nr:hypothetical protein H1C71_004832 [Ictidomys tridecemlineatus]
MREGVGTKPQSRQGIQFLWPHLFGPDSNGPALRVEARSHPLPSLMFPEGPGDHRTVALVLHLALAGRLWTLSGGDHFPSAPKRESESYIVQILKERIEQRTAKQGSPGHWF